MGKKSILRRTLIIFSLSVMVGCGGGSGTSQEPLVVTPSPPPPEPVLQSFYLLKENNPGLDDDIVFVLEGTTFHATLPTNASVLDLVPTFTYSGSQVSVGNVKQTSDSTSQDFTQILTYRVTNEADVSRDYKIDLTRFTGLPIIYLQTDEPVVSKEDYVEGTFRLEGGRYFDSIEEMEMQVRGRGNSTWFLHPKKPYQMKLESKRELFGMPEDKKWLFLAEYSDKSLLRNHLAFELGKRTSLRWTPSGHFAEVFVNGEHDGVYHITEKVEDGNNRVDIGDTGFLLEIDQPDRIDPDDVFFRTETYLINIKEPGLDYSDAEFFQVSDHLNEFETVLFSENFADSTSGYRAYADVDSFIDWFLVNEIAKNVDAQWYSSIFLYWIPGDKIYMGPIWDFDLGFGNVDYAAATYPEGWWVRWNTWIARMLEDPAFKARVRERYAMLDDQRPEIKGKIYEWSEQLNLSQAENDSIWQILGRYVWPNPVFFDTHEEEVEHLVDWLDTRMDWLAENIERL